jgi:hypothetical protein
MHTQRERAIAPICAQAKPQSGGIHPYLTESRGVQRILEKQPEAAAAARAMRGTHPGRRN